MSNATNLINTILSLFTFLFINTARASRTRKSLSCGPWVETRDDDTSPLKRIHLINIHYLSHEICGRIMQDTYSYNPTG